jgi:hypothetical protein
MAIFIWGTIFLWREDSIALSALALKYKLLHICSKTWTVIRLSSASIASTTTPDTASS